MTNQDTSSATGISAIDQARRKILAMNSFLSLSLLGALAATAWLIGVTQIFMSASIVICSVSLLFVVSWFRIREIFSQLDTVLSAEAEQINVSNAELRQRVQTHTVELEKTSAKLEKSLHAKSEFLATMSHEIRTPMNGVLGMSQLLVETDLSERQRRYVNIINASGKSLLEVLNNVLDFSKIEAGKMEMENIPFDLQSLIDECLGVFSLKAQERKVHLFGGLSKFTPRVLKGDPTRLRQVLVNLLSNAVKFTFDGNVSLKVSVSPCQPWAAERVTVLFVVSDEGIGIDQQQQNKLFTAFSQSDSTTTRKFGGTGLGLVISRQLLKLMGGDIRIVSEHGAGAKFEIQLPLAVLPLEDAYTYRPAENPLQETTVLIVERAEASKTYREQLQYCGANVLVASNRSEAIAAIHSLGSEKSIQVITGAMLEDGSGIELVEDLNRHFPDKDLRVMAITQISTESTETVPAGVLKILERPVTSDLLYKAVEQIAKTEVPLRSVGDVLPARADFGDVKALIAEDNQINQMVITGILKKFNITPTIVGDGADALSKVELEQENYDLILMDCEMPIMDGWQATELIRATEASRKQDCPAKIVALSAHVIAEHQAKARSCGMDRFVSKPVDIDSVGEILNDYFPRDSIRSAGEPGDIYN